jgi:hypothetical protein
MRHNKIRIDNLICHVFDQPDVPNGTKIFIPFASYRLLIFFEELTQSYTEDPQRTTEKV